MTYIMSVRRISGGKFTHEPGATHFLKVTSGLPAPDHRIAKRQWFKEVMAAAVVRRENGVDVGDVLFYVHGFNNTAEQIIERHKAIETGLKAQGFKGVVVSFDWPCDDDAINYLEDRHDAKQTAFRLVDEGIKTFAALQRPDCRINQHIFAHSMGCYVVREAFDDADDLPAVAATSWTVSQIMFAGADVSADGMTAGSSKSSSLYRHCVRLTNYYTPYDNVLTLSNVKRIGVSPRAGRVGLPASVPDKAVDVHCGPHYKRVHDPELKDFRKAHTWYFDDDDLIRDVFFTMSGDIDRRSIPGRALTSTGDLALV